MASHSASSSSSSSSSPSRWDVFLSFRGKDTRTTFSAHLYAALHQNRINTFMDHKLKNGDEISPALVEAIKESEISIIVLSKNYASSRWCLDELIKILDCRKTRGQQVLPLFYDVTPTEVRNQTNTVEKAFAQLKKRYKDDKKVKMWKSALTGVANLSGKSLEYRNEPEFIHEIIKWVNSILVKNTYFHVAKYPVGIESRVQDVKSLLDIENNDSTYMVGIFGIGGIGKTTIAKAIFNSMASQFEDSCFLENIRETSGQKGLIHLQNKLLSKILGGPSLMVDNVDQGITLIKKRLCLIRVLLVLDDVDHLEQLDKLARRGDWFPGSRIVITTRDKHLLSAHGVDSTYQVNELDHNEALQLFSWHAFNRDRPDDNFANVTEDVVSYAGGLPLALIVLGSDLKGRKQSYWENKLVVYKLIPHDDIQEKLRISIDGLNEDAKNIFLDIACFFKGENVEVIKNMLEITRGSHSYITAIEELEDKCLVTLSYCTTFMEMHDLLQEVGRAIVRQESPNEPSKRSRLWFHEDVRKVLEGNEGTNKVEGILIDLPIPDLIHLSPKAFKNMTRLKMFINRNACFSEEPKFLPNELRLLDWPNYPGESLPSNLCGKNLVVLSMPQSQLKELNGVQNFKNMKIMNFIGCEFLRKIPDVSWMPNLEDLDLGGCKNLIEVHHSVGFHDKLVRLKLDGCYNLRSFPRSLKMRSLKFLRLLGCSRLKNFPEIECQMECLEVIDLMGTGIEKLPSSIRYLVGVKSFVLSNCTNLVTHPDSKYLRLSGSNLFRTFDCCSTLKELNLSKSDIVTIPPYIRQFVVLEFLYLDECKQLQEILGIPPNLFSLSAKGCVSLSIFLEEANTPEALFQVGTINPALILGNHVLTESEFLIQRDCPSSLMYIFLSGSAIVNLPTWLNTFVGLLFLELKGCNQLEEISKLPPNIREVDADGCTSLKRFQFNNMKDLPNLYWIDFSNCHGLRENMGDDLQIGLFSEGHRKDCPLSCIFPGNKIPDCFNYRKELSNTYRCEIDINEPLHLDLENTRFAFSAVIGREDVQDEVINGDRSFEISVEVINDIGQHILSNWPIRYSLVSSDHVWLNLNVVPDHSQHVPQHSQLITDNLRVIFSFCNENHVKSVFFKSCGFHL